MGISGNQDPYFQKLSGIMQSDWDRRVNHDYRFWMSDGYQSDEAMWESGERDFKIITQALGSKYGRGVLLDLGCGVGRLLRPGLNVFDKVIGVDVSEKAIHKANELLGARPSLQLIRGNGIDLSFIPSSSVDVALSFAALSSIPTLVVANYLREIHRVLRVDGKVALQMYMGSSQAVHKEETLHLRCYARANLESALEAVGFKVDSISELVLPIQVSFKELGIEAVIVSLLREEKEPKSLPEIASLLLPEGEGDSANNTLGQDLEYWMSVQYAKELAEGGDLGKAESALEYAVTLSKTAAIDLQDTLSRITCLLHEKSRKEEKLKNQISMSGEEAGERFNSNLSFVSKKFPKVYELLKPLLAHSGEEVEIRNTMEGPVVYVKGQCLDHPEKPKTGAEAWAKRVMHEERINKSGHLMVVGCGGGYHLESLSEALKIKSSQACLSLVEPNPSVFLATLRLNNAKSWLSSITNLFIGDLDISPESQANYELLIRPQTQAVAEEYCRALRSRFYGRRGLDLLRPTIGVAGPLQGGTLPMVAYVNRALLGFNQKTREYDLSGYVGGYHLLERFVRDEYKRKGIEGTYCEMLSQIVLESINEKPVDILICMALAPISPRVLTELRKKGIITVLWFVEDYLRFTYWKDVARFYDFVFTIQKGKCLEAIREAGAGEVHYLPVACDPIVHAPSKLSQDEKQRWGSPVSFMGAGYHNRQQIFASLADLPLKIWGTEWPTCKPFDQLVQEKGRRLSPEEYVKVFNASDININLHSSTERDGVDPFGDFLNPRTFELAASGVFQLVDHRSLLLEAFEEGKEIVCFRNVKELKEKISYYLAHPEERRLIAERARDKVLSEHTYQHRIRKMLSIIYSSRFEQLKTKLDASPWTKTLSHAKRNPELYTMCSNAYERGEEPTLDALVSDIVSGKGKLSETEQKLLFLFHVRKQIIRMKKEELGVK